VIKGNWEGRGMRKYRHSVTRTCCCSIFAPTATLAKNCHTYTSSPQAPLGGKILLQLPCISAKNLSNVAFHSRTSTSSAGTSPLKIICERDRSRVKKARPILVSAIKGREFLSNRIPIRPIRMPRWDVSIRGTMGGMTLERNVSMDSWIEGGREGD
jgi:hypothetical protein